MKTLENAYLDDEDLILPRPRRGSTRRTFSVFQNVHAAYHALARRLEQILDDEGAQLSASEAVVLAVIAREPGAAIVVGRRETSLHPSTLTSVLDRLEGQGLIRRERSTWDHRFVAVWPTSSGSTAGAQIRYALRQLDEELGVHVHHDDLDATEDLAEAARAIGPRGTPPDY